MSLTVSQIHKFAPKERVYRKGDGHGLWLEVAVKGTKRWMHRYRFNGGWTMRTLGLFPEMQPSKAREILYQDKMLLKRGINPNKKKSRTISQRSVKSKPTLIEVFDEWYEKQLEQWSKNYADDVKERVVSYIFPDLGAREIHKIKTRDVVMTLQKMEKKGVIDTLMKVKSIINRVFLYAVSIGLIEYSPAAQISKDSFKRAKKRHYPHVTSPKKFKVVLEKIKKSSANQRKDALHYALELMPHLFLRPTELIRMEWEEVEFDDKLIRIGASRMKVRREHLVPMSDYVELLFKELREMTGYSKYVFPTISRKKNQPITPDGLGRRLKRIGVSSNVTTPHGFRHTASTLLNEMDFPPDIIEKQLSHTDRNTVRSVYNKAQHLPIRREMMQKWSEYILELTNR